jgi:hypothetical protein
MLKDFGLVNPSDYVGLPLEEAKNRAQNNGYTTRIVEMDGKGFMVTEDLKNNRLNFRVRGNVITDVYPG